MTELTDISDKIIDDDEDINFIHLLSGFIFIGNIVYAIIAVVSLVYVHYVYQPMLEFFNMDERYLPVLLSHLILNVFIPFLGVVASILIRKRFFIGYLLYLITTLLFIIGNIWFFGNLNIIRGMFILSICSSTLFIILLTIKGYQAKLLFNKKGGSELLDT